MHYQELPYLRLFHCYFLLPSCLFAVLFFWFSFALFLLYLFPLLLFFCFLFHTLKRSIFFLFIKTALITFLKFVSCYCILTTSHKKHFSFGRFLFVLIHLCTLNHFFNATRSPSFVRCHLPLLSDTNPALSRSARFSSTLPRDAKNPVFFAFSTTAWRPK